MNHLSGLDDFLKRWDEGEAGDERQRTAFRTGAGGNINREGLPSCKTATIFTRWDPSFRESIEPDVHELVMVLVERLNCITYSSCQGHMRSKPGESFSPRHVGIIPRNDAERERLLVVLCAVGEATNISSNGGHVRVVVGQSNLTSEGPRRTSIDVVFASNGDQEEAYFQDLEPVYDSFVRKLLLAVEYSRNSEYRE